MFKMIMVVLLMMCVGNRHIFLMEETTFKLFWEVGLGWINDEFGNDIHGTFKPKLIKTI